MPIQSPPSQMAVPAFLREGPVLLAPDNFTPLSRTPWGGEVIAQRYKGQVAKVAPGQRIGESWEFSLDPAAPSRLASGKATLPELIRDHGAAILSPALAATGRGAEILVKLLNAAEPLSLQVHPADDDPHLRPGECGKPESWLVLDVEPGAGLYLGFARSLSREELRAALLDGDRAKDLLHFVPVQPGDYFDLPPGVPHAIGAGVTLLEPQRVMVGQAGKTYRMWDWGRRYDANGRLDPINGQGRELHIEASLPLVDPQSQVGPVFADSLRRVPKALKTASGATAAMFPPNSYYQTTLVMLPKGAHATLSIENGYAALVSLAGETRCGGTSLPTGQSALLPHAALPLTFIGASDTPARFAVVTPSSATLEIRS